jgi:hypothetical protein
MTPLYYTAPGGNKEIEKKLVTKATPKNVAVLYQACFAD